MNIQEEVNSKPHHYSGPYIYNNEEPGKRLQPQSLLKIIEELRNKMDILVSER